MTRFVVDLGRTRLPEHKKNAISAGIQALVLRELVDIDFGLHRPIGVIPPGWLGYILREELAAIEAAQAEIQGFTRSGQAGE